MHRMEITMQVNMEAERKLWFSMWFLAAIATFGVVFFPMFYRLIENRNTHFHREAKLEIQIANFLRAKGKETPETMRKPRNMNAKAFTASIILIIPAFIVIYYLTRDLRGHEEHQDAFLAKVFPERRFMPQTIPIRKYVLITIVTLGVGGIYWLYKITNMYNAHFKAQWELEKEVVKLIEETRVGESV
jgi:hypothetical protein